MSDLRTKICSKCKIEKLRSEFYVRTNRAGGLQSRCKLCANGERWKDGRFRDEEHKERVLASNRSSYQRHKAKHQMRMCRRILNNKIAGLRAHGSMQCQGCGFRAHPAALDFDHRDPATKRFNLANALQAPNKYSWDEIVDEIHKCDVLCANCHRIRHAGCSVTGDNWELVTMVRDELPEYEVKKAKEQGQPFLGVDKLGS